MMKGQRKITRPAAKMESSVVKKKGCGCGKWKKARGQQA